MSIDFACPDNSENYIEAAVNANVPDSIDAGEQEVACERETSKPQAGERIQACDVPALSPPEAYPLELRNCRRWIGWRYEPPRDVEHLDEPDAQRTVVPCRLDGAIVAEISPEDRATFEEAYAAATDPRNHLDGIGWAVSPDDPYVGVDLVNAIVPGTHEAKPWAHEIVKQLASYAEISPDAAGVTLICQAKQAANRTGCRILYKGGTIWIRRRRDWFPLTGERLKDAPAHIRESDEALRALRIKVRSGAAMPVDRPVRKREAAATRPQPTADEVIRVARAGVWGRAFRSLWDGDIAGCKSESVAAIRLCRIIASYAGKRPVLIQEVFDRSQLAQKPKWRNRKDYRGRIIREAIQKAAGTFYDWRLPRIKITPNERVVMEQAIAALSMDHETYQRGGSLVRTVRRTIKTAEGSRERVFIKPLSLAMTRTRLADCAEWMQKGRRCRPPQGVAQLVIEYGEWPGIRLLDGVTQTPAMLPDGTILEKPGYDPDSGLYYAPARKFSPIPLRPTREDARRAAEELLDIVCDFCFATPSDRSAWLAAALTVLGRHAVQGPTPLIVFDGNTRGIGKGLLADTLGAIALGGPPPRHPQINSDDESRKRITATLVSGEPISLWDNVEGRLNYPSLAAVLTAPSWSDRLLGKSEMAPELPMKTIWLVTANNIQLGADIARRTLWVRLKVLVEHPEQRIGFKRPNLVASTLREQARLVVAGLTLLRAYHVAGRPRTGIAEFGSFEAWSSLIRQAIIWVGLPDPLQKAGEMALHADGESVAMADLLEVLCDLDPGRKGLTAAAIVEIRNQPNLGHDHQLTDIFARLGFAKDVTAHALGVRLAKHRLDVFRGRYLESRFNKDHTKVWVVQETQPKADVPLLAAEPAPEANDAAEADGL